MQALEQRGNGDDVVRPGISGDVQRLHGATGDQITSVPERRWTGSEELLREPGRGIGRGRVRIAYRGYLKVPLTSLTQQPIAIQVAAAHAAAPDQPDRQRIATTVAAH